MALLDKIKIRLGVFYSDPVQEENIQMMIDAGRDIFKAGGWIAKDEDPKFIEALTIFCKMARNTDPSSLRYHPVIVGLIVNGRNSEEEVDTDDSNQSES